MSRSHQVAPQFLTDDERIAIAAVPEDAALRVPLPRADGGFGLIFADPAWAFKTWSKEKALPQRAPIEHYQTMNTAELCAIPVSMVAAKDCVLIMWVISSHVEIAFEVADAWGFKFKSLGPVWRKTCKSDPKKSKMGMGFWFRQDCEIALVFTRGKPKRLDAGVYQFYEEPAREHSRKPDEFYKRALRLSGGPHLEMFARSKRDGWIVWGDEIRKFRAPRLVSSRKRSLKDLIGG